MENEKRPTEKVDILLLSLCWALTLTTSTLLTTIGPLAAEAMEMSNLVAPFTIGVFLFGAAASAVPSGIVFRRYGRYNGFLIGCLSQMFGAVIGAIALILNENVFLFVGCFFVGIGQGLGQFYRFAAVEISSGEMKSQAVTYVLSGGVIAAIAGPSIAQVSAHALGKEYSGGFFAMGGLGLLNWLVLSRVSFPDQIYVSKDVIDPQDCERHDDCDSMIKQRSTTEIIQQPLFILSCSVATIAHTVMIMIMSNCALSMKEDYSLHKASLAMEFHFLAMFLPGFFSGYLIKKFSAFLVSAMGAGIFASTAIIFAVGSNLWNYYAGMTLLGVAWNFSYSGATVMLTGCYTFEEASEVQAVNDFILLSTSGCGCLLSGVIFYYYNWSTLIYVASAMMALNFILFTFGWKLQTPTALKAEEYMRLSDCDNDINKLLVKKENGKRMRSYSGHSQGRNISIDYDSDSHCESISRLRCSSTGGFVT